MSDDSIIKEIGAQLLVLQPDNTSSICFEVNGKRSSRNWTCHINIRYFYVTDKVWLGDVVIVYLPTKDMVADYLTKPLNGTHFRTFGNAVMGLGELSIGQYKAQYENAKQACRN